MVVKLFLPVAFQALGISQELVIDKLLGRVSRLQIFIKCALNKVPQQWIVIVLDWGHWLCHYVISVSLLVTAHERWHQRCEFVCCYTDRPHIHTLAIGLALNQLRSHPVDRTALRLTMCRFLSQED